MVIVGVKFTKTSLLQLYIICYYSLVKYIQLSKIKDMYA